jgi:hypothetical protein
VPNTFIKIASVTVGSGGASTITFSSIPSTYTDLLIMTSLRDSAATVGNAGIRVIFNGSGSGFSTRWIFGTGVTANSTTDSGGWIRVGQVPGSLATSNTFSNDCIYVPNYLSSNQKTLLGDSVMENNATESYSTLTAGLWSNTAAITQIELQSNSTAWVQYSTATLYGIKNS